MSHASEGVLSFECGSLSSKLTDYQYCGSINLSVSDPLLYLWVSHTQGRVLSFESNVGLLSKGGPRIIIVGASSQ